MLLYLQLVTIPENKDIFLCNHSNDDLNQKCNVDTVDSSTVHIQILPIILVTSFIAILVQEPVHKHAWYLVLMSPFFF